MEEIKIGIDLGGSHVSVGAINLNRQILEQREKDFTVEEKKNLKEVAIHFMIDTINQLKEKYRISQVGLAVAGTVLNGVILKSVNLGIKDFDIKKELKEKISLPVKVRNDTKCAAIAEYEMSDLKQFQNVLFLTLGTGIGGAYIYQGKLLEGNQYEGFEFGHMVIKQDGILCRCGKKGCFEKYGSIVAFKNKIIERLDLSYDIPGVDLRKLIDEKKEQIDDIIEEYTNDLAIGISNLINIFEPDCITIGGGFSRYDSILLEPLKQKILNSNLLFNTRKDIILKTAKLGNDAGVIGASLL